MSVYCLVQNGEITRYNVTLPFSTPAFSVTANTRNLEDFGLYPVTGQEPAFDPVRERLTGPTYTVAGQAIERSWTVEQIPDEEKAGQIRAQRDDLLRQTVDAINPLRWEAMTADQQNAWRAYRQSLLDVPQQAGFPWEVTWPQKPTA